MTRDEQKTLDLLATLHNRIPVVEFHTHAPSLINEQELFTAGRLPQFWESHALMDSTFSHIAKPPHANNNFI
jgi:hypothetical protein